MIYVQSVQLVLLKKLHKQIVYMKAKSTYNLFVCKVLLKAFSLISTCTQATYRVIGIIIGKLHKHQKRHYFPSNMKQLFHFYIFNILRVLLAWHVASQVCISSVHVVQVRQLHSNIPLLWVVMLVPG